MLIVAREGREKEVVEIFNKWDLDAVVIGRVVEGDRLKVFLNGKLEADLPVIALTDEAPKYERPMAPVKGSKPKSPDLELGTWDLGQVLQALLASPNICSKHWVYEQYDTMVRTNTAILPGADAAVIRIKETRRAIAMCLDGSGKFTAIDPREGARLAVAEAARNVVCVGARPAAVTNCLNFASPERPEVMRSFSEVIDGMTEACNVFETPVVSGNVSFYNETEGRGILPTPVIGMVGVIADTRKLVTRGFKRESDLIALLGETLDDLAASEFAQTIAGLSTQQLIDNCMVPHVDLEAEQRVQQTVLTLADECLIHSAHDCSDGGLAVAIAESCFSSLGRDAVGAEITLDNKGLSNEALLFGETPSRIVISFDAEHLDRVEAIARNVKFQLIGKITGKSLTVKNGETELLSSPIDQLEGAWRNLLQTVLEPQ
jgi:phosphoribosylformylglycinamidine synthase